MNKPLYFGPEKDKKKWINWLSKLKHKVNDDGSVDVFQDIYISSKIVLSIIPFKFKNVKGSFRCQHNNLISLERAPQNVEGSFLCEHNSITSLEGAPQNVEGNFFCHYNKLISLKGGPQNVEGNFWCNNNKITSLKGAPKYVKDDFLCTNNNITSLEGAPDFIGGEFKSDNFSDEDYREYIKFQDLRKKLPELEGLI